MPSTAKKTFEAAAQAQAQLIVQLKDNQPTLLHKAVSLCAAQQPAESDTSVTKGRNRHETRTAEIFAAARAIARTDWQPLIKRVVRVTRDVLHRTPSTGLWSSTFEVAYYVANSSVSAHCAAAAIRGHWHIENKLHYTREKGSVAK